MKIKKWMRREKSGLAFSTLELAKYEEKQGHEVCIMEPGGTIIHGKSPDKPDVHTIHSQVNPETYHDNVPKFLWCHGEPISSVGNGVSMRAVVDLASICDAFICMRKEEWVVWNSIKRTYVVPKGIDLEVFHPLEGVTEKLSGEPSVLYIENWRGQRNPLYLCVAMQEVWKKYPKARLHLYNCNDKRMHDTFDALIKNNKWWTFIRSLQGAVNDVNLLYNRVDMVVSCLYPLYARGLEAFGAGKAFIGPGYRESGYPYVCQLQPESMAAAVINCWENYDKINYRKWCEEKHDVAETVKQSVEIYRRYL